MMAFVLSRTAGRRTRSPSFCGELELIFFEAEGAGHAAAAGVEEFDVCSGEAEEGDFVVHTHGGAVVAVAVDDDLFVDLRRAVVGGVFDEELAEEEGLVAEFLRARIVGEEVGELVAEDGGAAWFEDDDGCASCELRGEGVEGFEEIFFGGVEHAEVVERAAAAEMLCGERDAEASRR